MKNKTFVIIVAALLLSLSVYAPVVKLLESAGVVSLPQMGNIIEPEKAYGSVILDTLEYAKATVGDIYINYLPAYASVVTALQTAKINFNRPFNDLLSNIAAKPAAVTDVITDAVDAPDETTSDTAADTDVLAVTDETTAAETAEAISVTGGRTLVSHKSRFLKSSGEGINYYAVDASFDDGSTIGLITTAFNTPEKTYASRMRKTAGYINAIAEADESVNVWVYVCSRLQDSESFADIVPGEVSLYPLITEFFSLLDDRIGYDRFKIDTLEDSVNKLFLTDHHWNAYGMYEAYTDIVRLIYGGDADGILRPIGERYDIEDADFYGTFARTSGYYDYHDDFFFYDYALPSHRLVANDPYKFEDVKTRYLDGKFSRDLGADHYVNFYPYTQYIKYPDNDTGRVLLLLGDSYSRGISELLCSAFDEAYVFDYRRIKEIGDYRKFIEEKGVTDVLFMQYSLRGVFDNQNDNTLQIIKVD